MNYERSVFINCPFDEAYKPLLNALLFTIADSGYLPRTALDRQDSSEVRISKIYDVLGQCGLAVHDLSRTDSTPANGLPRFNMPLEFGVFLGAKVFGDEAQRKKVCLVFDRAPYRYQAYISDVAGQDIAAHGDDPRSLMITVRDWLASVARHDILSGAFIWTRYQTFLAELPAACRRVKQTPGSLTYREYLGYVDQFRVQKTEELRVEKGGLVHDPDPYAITRAIRNLDPDSNAFAVYTRGGNGSTYIQAQCLDKDAFDLEYQEGSLENHYSVAKESVTREEVVSVFLRYSIGDDSWKADYEWVRMEL